MTPPLVAVANFFAGMMTLAILASSCFMLAGLLDKREQGKMRAFFTRHGILLGALVGIVAIGGSLFYSEIAHYKPCVLCWWQRIFIYPSAIIFLIAYARKEKHIFPYTLVLASIGLVFAIYHNYLSWGGPALGVCDIQGLCTKLYVNEFGFVTIPLMSFSVLLFFLLLSLINKTKKA